MNYWWVAILRMRVSVSIKAQMMSLQRRALSQATNPSNQLHVFLLCWFYKPPLCIFVPFYGFPPPITFHGRWHKWNVIISKIDSEGMSRQLSAISCVCLRPCWILITSLLQTRGLDLAVEITISAERHYVLECFLRCSGASGLVSRSHTNTGGLHRRSQRMDII